jgi:hypothetical protein
MAVRHAGFAAVTAPLYGKLGVSGMVAMLGTGCRSVLGLTGEELMDPLATGAFDDPSGVAALLEARPDVMLGDVLVGLRSVADQPIDFDRLDTRSCTTLRRMRCSTWGDLADRRVREIWSAPNAGRLTVRRILTAAAERNAQEGAAAGQLGRSPASTTEDVAARAAIGPGVARLDRLMRDLARWGVRERGAGRLSDLLVLSPRLGRIPDEILGAFDRLSDFPLADLVGPAGADLPSSLLADLLTGSGARVDVLVQRKIRLGARPTLQELGKKFGVTRERVRQLEGKAAPAVRQALGTQRFAPVRWRAEDLSDVLGVAVPADSELLSNALSWATRGLDEPPGCEKDELMLWLAGPYDADSGWLIRSGQSLRRLFATFASRVADDWLIDEDDASHVLDELGVATSVLHDFVELMGTWRRIDDACWVRWMGAVGDKAEIVLRLVGEPRSVDEINDHIGEGHAASSLRNALASDPRFVRIDKAGNFALSEWGMEEYSGIANEIVERIERAGGEVDLEDLVSEFVSSFGVSQNSIRMYAASPAFILQNGRVRLRNPAEPYKPDDRVFRVRGLYVGVSGHVIVHDMVDNDVLRGSGRQLPEPAAASLGMQPGDRLAFAFQDGSVVVSWPRTSVMGPSLGSVRRVAAKLGLEAGDRFRLIFDPAAMTCVAESVDPSTLEGLTGLHAPLGLETETVAAALRVDPKLVRARLQARGDNEVLAMLPPDKSSDNLGEAISKFGDLLGA